MMSAEQCLEKLMILSIEGWRSVSICVGHNDLGPRAARPLRTDVLVAVLTADNKALPSRTCIAQWIWLEAAMSILSIAAPVWFAWLSTRQIGQRFKLAEDYGFKAAVAQAYEGYRKEAVRLDPQLEARLFGSALDRLEEPPSRFLPHVDHNSPYEALLESTGFQRALEKLPNLRETMQAVLDKVSANDASVVARVSTSVRAQDE
ncbi:hypothetical protein Q1W73_13885 [Asticcacaulis sp. ZE23SCel15]|uniref:hypothetical protein n=1 Tax=Asticcacaulis sp. ZE23SCel15 TaxID=3059027 RepID=UPI00265F8F7A|nr:hypothetical protein [Asticcacaulis sp. ZE23SCel15]WKL56750.1 hypothetical protein Q1W73_13885 [Asticcacaulis sp. ZE23SCel15]